MTFAELNQRINKYASAKALEQKLGTFLKQNPHLVMNYQLEQLFKESIGSDEQPLGFYSYNTAAMSKIPSEKKGQTPFTMYESGSFFNNMYINITGRKNVNIEIGSRTPHLQAMLSNPAFETTNFFGLTQTNYQRLAANLSTMLEEWVIKGITK